MIKYKCCLCKKSSDWQFCYFHHFTPKMKERYQCINCRFDNDSKQIAKAKEDHKVFINHMKFLDSLLKIK